MRIVKLSKEALGVYTLAGCKAFFETVLPCENNEFDIVGEGSHIAKNAIAKNEPIVFSFDGILVCIALVDDYIVKNNKVVTIILKTNTIKVLKNTIELKNLESVLQDKGYDKQLLPAQGWNIIDGKLEKVAIQYLRNEDWKQYYEIE